MFLTTEQHRPSKRILLQLLQASSTTAIGPSSSTLVALGDLLICVNSNNCLFNSIICELNSSDRARKTFCLSSFTPSEVAVLEEKMPILRRDVGATCRSRRESGWFLRNQDYKELTSSSHLHRTHYLIFYHLARC